MKSALLSLPAAVPLSAKPTAVFPHSPEHHPRQWIVYALLAILVGLFGWAVAGFHQPANSGVDQNGYMATARMLGNFLSLMGVIWLACNPVTLTYANDANSHGA
ncbi:MAG: hypothetical protein HKL95_00345, partial [Phycisphaerae bacterium]|nr:hypothetical protein [Phycisphaerae bacterium]